MDCSFKHMLSRPNAINIAHVVEHCRVLGPGNRFVIWVQGCPLRCPGCHNPQFQPFENRLWLDVDKVAAMILTIDGIEGVTYVGGEPFAQTRALANLSKVLHTAGLSVMTYSGFTIEQVQSGTIAYANELLAQTDLLLDGPYRQDVPSNRPWRGSDNQRLISLSERYKDRINEWNLPTGQQFEFRLTKRGEVEVLGIPPLDLSHLEPSKWHDKSELKK